MKTNMTTHIFKPISHLLIVLGLLSSTSYAAGVLTPVGSNEQAIQTRSHHVNVVINNGFAKTTFTQVFYNPNSQALEGTYRFPVPKNASLSEMIIYAGENTLRGEVVKKEDAERIYEEEKSQGNDAGLGTKNSYENYTFKVYPIPANAETRMEVVYYQPIDIDTGMGRYVYPLEEGGTDEVAQSFWTMNETIQIDFTVDVTLKSAHPIKDVRVPNFSGNAQQDEQGNWTYSYQSEGGSLNKDFVFYYRLAENLPGRVEIIPYKSAKNEDGTFMMVITPGLDLKPLTQGADYVFVLDKSGSMSSKIYTLAQGVEQALGILQPHDRFHLIVFDDSAKAITSGWTAATQANVQKAIEELKNVPASGSTNIYDGLYAALKDIDDDRATSLILVTDGVTNTGIIDPAKFYDLLKQYDLRVFGFLMGNSSNWPLMRSICEASDGFYTTVSNSDDIVGKILQAKSKVTHECLHDISVKISGVKTYNVTQNFAGKIFRGQQLVLFGRYDKGGRAKIRLEANFTSEDHDYVTEYDFPEVSTTHPEIERLWAMSQIEEIELLQSIGRQPESEARDAIADLGVKYQLVTDETSMLVLRDEAFEKHGIERRNLTRTEREHQAQAQRNTQPVQNHRVDSNNPMFQYNAPSIGGGGGGGAFGLEALLMLLGLTPLLHTVRSQRN